MPRARSYFALSYNGSVCVLESSLLAADPEVHSLYEFFGELVEEHGKITLKASFCRKLDNFDDFLFGKVIERLRERRG